MVTRMHKLQLVLLAWDRGYRDLGKGARKWAFERGLRRVRLTKKHFRQKEKHRQRSGSCPWGWPFVRWGSGPPMPQLTHLPLTRCPPDKINWLINHRNAPVLMPSS